MGRSTGPCPARLKARKETFRWHPGTQRFSPRISLFGVRHPSSYLDRGPRLTAAASQTHWDSCSLVATRPAMFRSRAEQANRRLPDITPPWEVRDLDLIRDLGAECSNRFSTRLGGGSLPEADRHGPTPEGPSDFST